MFLRLFFNAKNKCRGMVYHSREMKFLSKKNMTLLVVALLAFFVFRTVKSGYSPLKIKVKSDQSIFTLKNDLECTPGHKKGSMLSKGLTPGGLCGAGDLVAAHASYEIEDGVGGGLM